MIQKRNNVTENEAAGAEQEESRGGRLDAAVFRSACPFDCPDTCSMKLSVKDGRIQKIEGDREHPRTCGYLCRKMRHYPEMIGSRERILTPLRRTGAKGEGKFERISWEEALREISGRWKAIIGTWGAEAILPYSYGGVMGAVQRKCGEAFFHYMGASRLERTICSSAKGAGWEAVMGKSFGRPSEALVQSDCIFLWGSNVAATRLHEIPYLKEARKRGAKVVLIETYETLAAAYCDELYLVRPGSDGALALAMLHVLRQEGLLDLGYIREWVLGWERLEDRLETCTPEWAAGLTGLAPKQIRALAGMYGRAKAPAILLGSGPSRLGNGGMNVRCICALPAAVGAWRQPGGGIYGCACAGSWFDKKTVTREDFDPKPARIINMNQLATALNDPKLAPPVMGLYVYASNPANVTANQAGVWKGLLREDLFTVVHERFLTDTARCADIILPAAFSTEQFDVYTPYGYNGIQYAKKITEPAGECCSNWDTFRALAEAMGYEEPYFCQTEEELCRTLLNDKTGQLAHLTEEERERLLDGHAVVLPLPQAECFGTRSGKIELYREDLAVPLIGYQPPHGGAYPLQLVAAPGVYTLNSTFTTVEKLTKGRGRMTLRMNAGDASARGLSHGDLARCRNDWGEALFYIATDRQVAPGTVVAEGVYTFAQAPGRFTANALFAERLADLAGATTMNDNTVEVYPA